MKTVSLLAVFFLFLAPVALAEWNPTMVLTNTGQTASNSTTVNWYDSSGVNTFTYQVPSLPPSGSLVIDNAGFDLPSGDNYSAVVNSDQPLVSVIGNNYNDTTVNGAGGWSDPAAKVYFPVVNTCPSSDWNNHIAVQNTSDQTNQVTCGYYNSDGSQVSSSSTSLPPQGRYEFAVYNYDIPGDFTGSAVVTAEQPVAASMMGSCGDNTWAYEGVVPPGSGDTTVYLPSAYGSGYGDWTTWVGVQNCGSDTATVFINYYCPYGSLYNGGTVTIPPYGNYQWNMSTVPGLPAGYSYSAVFQSNQPIAVAEVNRNSNGRINAYQGWTSGGNTGWHP
ncbi:MAG: hypothetical protein JRC92_09800 [Deltaproteobacteria bacterium]|nr:hypothetical protein [Deltaproteobacteria bacterium]